MSEESGRNFMIRYRSSGGRDARDDAFGSREEEEEEKDEEREGILTERGELGRSLPSRLLSFPFPICVPFSFSFLLSIPFSFPFPFIFLASIARSSVIRAVLLSRLQIYLIQQ
tara:strand:+ start:82 stop:420 length:339 start_codon:yes stop_codon:yes gene_type:complete